MSNNRTKVAVAVGWVMAGILATAPPVRAVPATSAFTYQGKIDNAGTPASGSHNFQFKLFDAASAGSQVGVTQTANGVTVTNGLFTLPLDFGAAAFDGSARWMEIAVQGPGDAGFTTLAPRQPITAAPYAIRALTGGGGLTLPFAGSSNSPNIASFDVVNSASTGSFSHGIHGQSTGHPLGVGLRGDGTRIGVWGEGQYGSYAIGSQYGAYGSSSFGYGVYGTSVGSEGVHGESQQSWGVYGRTYGSAGAGVFGQSAVNNTAGVLGRSEATGDGEAVFGYASSNAVGVKGVSEGNDGMVAASNAANKSGIWAYSTSASGYGAAFNNFGGGVALLVNGLAQVTTLQIMGGADLAERFSSREAAEPGTVMAIDPDAPGHMRVADEPYCRRVAGVVSGANDLKAGVVLSEEGTSGDTVPIALTGRVWVKCDATRAPIRPGDLLTTSAREGHAMAAVDPARAAGAILGKAMTSLERGTGMVLVLVSLQ